MRYEYKFIYSDRAGDFEAKLNDAGKDGWRLDKLVVADKPNVASCRYNAVMVKESLN